ncbi:O-acetylhomoserine ami [Mycena epipterygia]|nr:O-acetylhomoserine ami [Mycena epipterygia]
MTAPNPESDFETLQLHAGQALDSATKARAVSIYQSTSFIFKSVEHAQRLNSHSLQDAGNLYARISNPTVDVFEKRMAALESGMAAVATASGQAATALTISSLATVEDNIVASSRLYGGRYGIDCTFVTGTDPADYAAAINEKTKAVDVESISNSDTVLVDIAGLSKIAHDHSIPHVVDNTLEMGGYMLKPIALGADIVDGATKWISGHGTTIAGIIIDSGKFDWRKSDEFPMITGARLADVFFPVGFALQVRIENLCDLDPCLSPNAAFMVLQDIETLSLRAQRTPRIISVSYLGLPMHPSHQVALKMLRSQAFDRAADKVKKVINNLKLASHLANLGDAKTLVIAPFIKIQAQLTAEERVSTGVIDMIPDIITDLEGAFKVAYK